MTLCVFLSALAGCGGSDLTAASFEADQPDRFAIQPRCLVSQCDADRRVACKGWGEMASSCSRMCTNLASSYVVCDCDWEYEEARKCEDCSGVESACLDQGFEAKLRTQRDEKVYAACSRAVARDEKCNEATVNSACDLSARVERSEAVVAYDCHATTPCGTSTDGCGATLPAADMAAKLCDVLRSRCGEALPGCVDEKLLDAGFFSWLRPEVNSELARCFEQKGCGQTRRCLDAFLSVF
ncbi:MAG: hypothetical protein KC503_11475 [Myxococcales bacterium]|nr:hypothetical protein [Myxococcales bacterium]